LQENAGADDSWPKEKNNNKPENQKRNQMPRPALKEDHLMLLIEENAAWPESGEPPAPPARGG
jgi:hypothetical protein